MILQLDYDYQKIAHAIAFVDMYINAPESVDEGNVYKKLRSNNSSLTTNEAIAILLEMVDQHPDEYTRSVVIKEMRTPEFRKYIRAVMRG